MEVCILHILPHDGIDGKLEVFSTEREALAYLRDYIVTECWDYDTMGHPDDSYDVIDTYETSENRIVYQTVTRTVDKFSDFSYCY